MPITKDWILTMGRRGASIHSDSSGTIAQIPDDDANWRDHAVLLHSAPRRAEQVRILREALSSIRDGSGPLGRWLDSENDTAIEEEGNDGTDEENVPENPNAVWEPYTEEEQRLWLDSVVAIADRALEATKEGA